MGEGRRGRRGARRFPWGDAPDPDRANYDATGIGGPSPVGCFPAGASPYGVEDLSGNVWEWTRSLWGADWNKPTFRYPYDPTDGREDLDAPVTTPRVLRGGAFSSSVHYVRCAVRIRHHPDDANHNVGFRVATRDR